ncbi:MAG: hypothetical protein ACC645_06945 [Pirellulales bacterium]
MRWILIIALLLFGSAATACLLPVPQETAGDAPKSEWVRTRDGWESQIGWGPPPPLYEPAIHPIVVASGEIFLSLIALIAFSTEPSHSRAVRSDVPTVPGSVRKRRATRNRAHRGRTIGAH